MTEDISAHFRPYMSIIPPLLPAREAGAPKARFAGEPRTSDLQGEQKVPPVIPRLLQHSRGRLNSNHIGVTASLCFHYDCYS